MTARDLIRPHVELAILAWATAHLDSDDPRRADVHQLLVNRARSIAEAVVDALLRHAVPATSASGIPLTRTRP